MDRRSDLVTVLTLRRQLGAEVRRLRDAAGLTQDTLARRIGYSRVSVALVETGRQEPGRPFVDRLELALVAEGALAELHERLLVARAGQPRQHPAAAEEGARPSRSYSSTDLAAIHAAVLVFRTADRQMGGGHLYRTVRSYLQSEIGPRLLSTTDDQTNLALLSAASSLTEMIGWMAHDCGQDKTAQQHFRQAGRLAGAAGDRLMSAQVMASMSYLSCHLEQPNAALTLAEAASERARQGTGDLLLEARLHAMRARALARLRHSRECGAALDGAERALAGSAGSETSRWASPFDEGSLSGEAAGCMLALGHHNSAERHALRTIQLRSDRLRSRAFAQLALAMVHVARRDVDAAATIGTDVLRRTLALRSAGLMQRLNGLATALRAGGRISHAAESFLEEQRRVAASHRMGSL